MTNPENFDPLLKLLSLKRREQPPPGYFDRLAQEIQAQLKAGEGRRRSWVEDLLDEASWVRKVWSLLEAKPAVAGLFGAVVSGLLLAGIVSSQRIAVSGDGGDATQPRGIILTDNQPVFAQDQPPAGSVLSSTNPVSPPGWLFDGVPLKTMPASLLPEMK